MSEAVNTTLPLSPSASSLIGISVRGSRRVLRKKSRRKDDSTEVIRDSVNCDVKARRDTIKRRNRITPKFVIDFSDSECDPPSKRYKCDRCTYSSDRISNFKRHGLKHATVLEPKGKFKCPEFGCQWLTTRLEQMDVHLRSEHGRNIEVEDFTFNNIEEFQSLKNDLRDKEFCWYVSKGGTSKRSRVYYCHRSSILPYKPSSKGIRKVKKQGSNKCKHLCTSRLIVLVTEESGLKVKYCKTHSGHTIIDPDRIGPRLGKRKKKPTQLTDVPAVCEENGDGIVDMQDMPANNWEEDTTEVCLRIGSEYFQRIQGLVKNSKSGNAFVDIMQAGLSAMELFLENGDSEERI